MVSFHLVLLLRGRSPVGSRISMFFMIIFEIKSYIVISMCLHICTYVYVYEYVCRCGFFIAKCVLTID